MTQPWIDTYNGARLWFYDPKHEDILWPDVFHALAIENRYNGHTSLPYSVGQHMIAIDDYMVGIKAPIGMRRVMFLHDLPEFILKDQTAPLKHVLNDAYTDLEQLWLNSFCVKTGWFTLGEFTTAYQEYGKAFDQLAYRAESELLRPYIQDPITTNDKQMKLCVTRALSHDWQMVSYKLNTILKDLI